MEDDEVLDNSEDDADPKGNATDAALDGNERRRIMGRGVMWPVCGDVCICNMISLYPSCETETQLILMMPFPRSRGSETTLSAPDQSAG